LSLVLFTQKRIGRELVTALAARHRTVRLLVTPVSRIDSQFPSGSGDGVLHVTEDEFRSDMIEPDDLIVTAHSHYIVPQGALDRAAEAIGFHPSLLPLHPGKHAIEESVRGEDPLVGGTVYRLTAQIDQGPIVSQHALVPQQTEPSALWHESLLPLGVSMLLRAVDDWQAGNLRVRPQDQVEIHSRAGRMEVWVLSMWREVLADQTVMLDDDFLDVGGHSLLALRLLARASAVLGIPGLPASFLWEHETPRRFAHALL
jgi:hypothetical protein